MKDETPLAVLRELYTDCTDPNNYGEDDIPSYPPDTSFIDWCIDVQKQEKESGSGSGFDFKEKELELLIYISYVKEVRKVVVKAEGLIDKYGRNSDGHTSKRIAVCVKRYRSDQVDIDELVDEISKKENLTTKEIENLKDSFDEDRQFNIHNDWLEFIADYFVNNYIAEKCCISSQDWWQEQIDEYVNTGINFMVFNKEWTIQERIDYLVKRKERDKLEEKHLNNICKKDVFFFGRSGGWLSLADAGGIQDSIDSIELLLGDVEDAVGNEDINTYLCSLEYYTEPLKPQLEAVDWLIGVTKEHVKGMDFKAELTYKVEEEVYEIKEITAYNKKKNTLINVILANLKIPHKEQVKFLSKQKMEI